MYALAVDHHGFHRTLGQAQHAADHHPLAAVERSITAIVGPHQIGDFLAHLVGLHLATHQAQHGVGRALAQSALAAQALLALPAHQLVGHLDQQAEADGGIQVAFRDMEAQAFGGQAETDHQQEAQAEHDHRRVLVDETRQRLAGNHHQADGEDDRDHHHFQLVDHAHGGNHRVEGEHRVQHHDLRHHRPEGGIHALAVGGVYTAFQALMQLQGRLEQQEQATEQHDQVAAGEALAEYLDQRLGERDQPGNARQQAQAHQQRQRQADQPRAVAQVRRQLVREDRDEDQVIDAEHQLEQDQGEQAKPGRGIHQPFHADSPRWVRAMAGREAASAKAGAGGGSPITGSTGVGTGVGFVL